MNTKDIILGSRFMGLHIGRNGSGKTIAAASLHKIIKGKIKFFDFDGRMTPVRTYYPDADIEYDTYGVRDIDRFRTEFNSLERNNPYSAIVLDSLTSLSMTLVNWQMVVKGQSGGKTLKSGIAVPGWDEINGETQFITQVLDVCKILKCHVILTAHPVERTEIGTGTGRKFQTLVAFGNKINSMAPGYFDEIYYFLVEPSLAVGEEPRRIALTSDDGINYGKTALPINFRYDWTRKDFYPLIVETLHEHKIKLEGEKDVVKL